MFRLPLPVTAGAFITTLTEEDLASIGVRMNGALTLRVGSQEVECRFSAHPFVGIAEGAAQRTHLSEHINHG